MSEPFTREERDRCVARVRETEAAAYVPNDPEKPRAPLLVARALDAYYAVVAEYADRLPRTVLGACPFTGKPLLRSFDPYGFDGPWWHTVRTFAPDEPGAPSTFRVLLGAVDLRGRVPVEATNSVIAGPGAPYVVPRLLEMPGMVAVVHRVEMATGDIAYPIAYFSRDEIHPSKLHQPWTRPDLWFKAESGDSVWTMKNDVWDFDLAPWIERGQLAWVEPGSDPVRVLDHRSGRPCPYVGLPGVRMQQLIAKGAVSLMDPPDGEMPVPFEMDDEGEEPAQ